MPFTGLCSSKAGTHRSKTSSHEFVWLDAVPAWEYRAGQLRMTASCHEESCHLSEVVIDPLVTAYLISALVHATSIRELRQTADGSSHKLVSFGAIPAYEYEYRAGQLRTAASCYKNHRSNHSRRPVTSEEVIDPVVTAGP
jgi:hypothetical protein